MHFSPEKSITDHFKKLRELQQRGGCKKFLTRMFLDRNSKDFQDNDLHQGGFSILTILAYIMIKILYKND